MGRILYVIYFNGVTAGIKEGYARKKEGNVRLICQRMLLSVKKPSIILAVHMPDLLAITVVQQGGPALYR